MKLFLVSPIIAICLGNIAYAGHQTCHTYTVNRVCQVDKCPNITGFQKEIPKDLVLFEGDCVSPPDDVVPPVETPPAVVPAAPSVIPVVDTTPPIIEALPSNK